MLITEQIQVTSNMGDERRGAGVITIQKFLKQEMLMNAAKKLGLFWMLAFFSIFIPFLHFFLVPCFLIVGVITARKSFNSAARVLQGETACPYCQKEIKIGSSLLNWPLTEICQNCVNTIRINKTTLV